MMLQRREARTGAVATRRLQAATRWSYTVDARVMIPAYSST